MKNKILTIILILLALHLIFSNTSLLVDMQEMINKSDLNNWQYALRIAFALSYSILTVLILTIYPKIWIVTITGLLDGFSVYLKYNINQPYFLLIGAIFFGVYTFVIVLTAGIISAKKLSETKSEKNQIKNEIENQKSEIQNLTISQNEIKNEIQICENSQSESENEKIETESELTLSFLLQQKKRLQNSLNATKNESLKVAKIEELKNVELLISQIQN